MWLSLSYPIRVNSKPRVFMQTSQSLLLDLRWAQSLVDRCRWKGHGTCNLGHQNFITNPCELIPTFVSFWPVLFGPVEPDWVLFKSKRKLYSLIKEWRNSGPHSKMHTPKRPLERVLIRGRKGWSSSVTAVLLTVLQIKMLGEASGHKVHCWHLEEFCAMILKYQGKPFHTRDTGQKCQVQGPFTMDPMSKWDKNKPKGRGKKLDCILLFYLMYLMYPGFFASHPVLRQARFHDFHYPDSPQNSTELEDQIQKKQRILPFYIIWVHRLLKHVCLLQSKYFHSDKQVLIL